MRSVESEPRMRVAILDDPWRESPKIDYWRVLFTEEMTSRATVVMPNLPRLVDGKNMTSGGSRS